MMKGFTNKIVLTIVLMLSVAQILQAQTMHVLLFVNEKEVGREVDRCADMNNMYNFFNTIAQTIGYRFSCTKNSDTKFTRTQAMSELRRLQTRGLVGGNDVVVFYYSGHGFNDATTAQDYWPSMCLFDDDLRRMAPLKQLDVKKELDKIPVKPRLVLCIADCCNNVYDPRNNPSISYGMDPATVRNLFVGGKKKVVMTSASKQGQYSLSNLRYGAYFGISFREAINNAQPGATWNSVMEYAKKRTLYYTDNQQTPQYKVSETLDLYDE